MTARLGLRSSLIVYAKETEDFPASNRRHDGPIGIPSPCEANHCQSNENSDDLIFDSAFEGGNLQTVVKIGTDAYELYLTPDQKIGSTQWFYFSVANIRKGSFYQFKIVNLTKQESSFCSGQQPLVFSTTLYRKEGTRWFRAGSDIKYGRNGKRKDGSSQYALSFGMEFPCVNDKCFLAYCYPYTFTDLQTFMNIFKLNAECSRCADIQILCKSALGRDVPIVTITAPSPIDDMKKKRGIFITSRVHPGESNASWVVQGFMNFLIGDSVEAKNLLSAYVFCIIPMLNPDGCSSGTYRSDINGFDLNRQWADPDEELHPSIFYAKKALVSFCSESKVEYFIDIHGHSAKFNCFLYGCEAKQLLTRPVDGVEPQAPPFASNNERLLAQMLEDHCSSFSFRDSTFTMSKEKESTGRVVAWRDLGIKKSYTMEISLSGYVDKNGTHIHFTSSDLENIGRSLAIALHMCSQRCENEISTHQDLQMGTNSEDILAELSFEIPESDALQKVAVLIDDVSHPKQAIFQGEIHEGERSNHRHVITENSGVPLPLMPRKVDLEMQCRASRTSKLQAPLTMVTFASERSLTPRRYDIADHETTPNVVCTDASIPTSMNKREWNLWNVFSRLQNFETKIGSNKGLSRCRRKYIVENENRNPATGKKVRNDSVKNGREPTLCVKTVEFRGQLKTIHKAREAGIVQDSADDVKNSATSHDWSTLPIMPSAFLNRFGKIREMGMSPLAENPKRKSHGKAISFPHIIATAEQSKLPELDSSTESFTPTHIASANSSEFSGNSRVATISDEFLEFDSLDRSNAFPKQNSGSNPARKFFSPRNLGHAASGKRKGSELPKPSDYERKAVGPGVRYLPFMLGKASRPVIP